jgi:hypothetical protein
VMKVWEWIHGGAMTAVGEALLCVLVDERWCR